MSAAPDESAYGSFADRVRAEGLVSDPWVDGKPRFDTRSRSVSRTDFRAAVEAAEAMASVHDELVRLLLEDERLFDRYFSLGTVGKALWHWAAPRWHGIARADVFLTAGGPVLCELNSDTPSGQAEAITLSRIFADEPGEDPNRELRGSFCDWVAFEAGAVGKRLDDLTVGVLYPTELTEDLGLVLLYERWLASRGARVVLGSPFNLEAMPDGRVALLGQPCDVFLRHYKTDWWAERSPVWTTEEAFPDAEPLSRPLALLCAAEHERKAVVLNPFGAIVTQNKRSLALLWEERHRLAPDSRNAVLALLPPTFRLESLAKGDLRGQRDAWVLKSDYGCEGEETIVGNCTSQEAWEEALEEAAPGRWIAQQAFTPVRDSDGCACNLGVYLIGGRACGLYARRSVGPTDVTALSAAVKIREDEA